MRFRVEAPVAPAVAFAEVADFGNLPSWDPFVERCSLTGPPLEQGSVYSLQTPMGLTLHYELMEVMAPSHATYRGGTARVTSVDTIQVAGAQGGSRIEVSSSLHFRGRTRPLGPLIWLAVWLGGRFISLPAMRKHLGAVAVSGQ